MKVEEAIKMAIVFEKKVRDLYFEASAQLARQECRKVLEVLAHEEQRHVDYLEFKLNEWLSTGRLNADAIDTVIPSKEKIAQGSREVGNRLAVENRDSELQILGRALEVETETSDFYRKMVDTMELDARKMFARFLEIETGHLAIVEAEIDAVQKMGFWFDMPEFNLEIQG